jgi:hypothetical protein
MILNVHSRSFLNVRERLRMIMNDYERSYVHEGTITKFETVKRKLVESQEQAEISRSD